MEKQEKREAPVLEVIPANKIGPTQGSLWCISGPPGLGKSWLCGTMAEYLDPREILVIATLPREVNSIQYQEHGLDTVVITDDGWQPSEDKLNATGYRELMGIIRGLRKDTKYTGIILDNGTEAAELAWHAALEPLGVGDPGELSRGSNRFTPYTSLREKMEELMCALAVLTGKTGFAERPKLVAVPWHIQPPKETGDDETADQKGKGSEYEGEFLPMIRGAYRRRIGGIVDATVYANLVKVPGKTALSETETHYCVQLISDRERHVKLPGRQPDPKTLLKGQFLDIHNKDNAWRMLMDIISPPKRGK